MMMVWKKKIRLAVKEIKLLIAMSALIFSIVPQVAADGEGTTGAAFLKIGPSARAESMGGAFTATVDDVDASYWNPAGLMQLKRTTIGLSHLEWFQDIRYEYISYASKFDYIGAIGVSLGFLYLGDIPKTLETIGGEYNVSESGGTFGASDLAINLSWAANLGLQQNKIGATVKIINESIDENGAFSVALDVGDQFLVYQTDWYQALIEEHFASRFIPSIVAVAVKNLGTPLKFFEDNDPLPLNMSLGLAYKFFNDNLTAALDLNYYQVEALLGIHAGAEYWLRAIIKGEESRQLDLALRAGYRSGYDSTSALGLALGAGLKYGGLGLDYAYMPFGDLGSTHRLSVKISWGELLKDEIASKPKTVTTKKLSASERELRKTAAELRRQKRKMEGKTSIKKSDGAKRSLTAVEAKKPQDQEVAKETKSLGADINLDASKQREVVIGKGVVIKGRSSKVNKDLIAQITSGQRPKSARIRTRSSSLRRTQKDVIRAAKREAEKTNRAFEAVEQAAKKDAGKLNQQVANVTRTSIYFAKDSSKLNNRYLFALDKIALSFDKNPGRTILIHGHASTDEKDKQSLAMNRAKTVKEYLVQIKSIPSTKIAIKGFADKQLAKKEINNRTRAQNRRVRVRLIKAGN